ncbi:hypothetical protein [Sterolibacterium denitrificans]|uniref:hypothetical protein n=1 Tax=Sterolibacterium denitrificans TaxID=157592 RepID=UPI001561D8B3|nr:hypothetical protein [Sterolibacterium denitrificans]
MAPFFILAADGRFHASPARGTIPPSRHPTTPAFLHKARNDGDGEEKRQNLKLLGGVEYQSSLALGFGSIVCRHLPPKRLARLAPLLGGLNALDAAPTFTALGFDLAHLFFRVMRTAVIAEKGVSHRSLSVLRGTVVNGVNAEILPSGAPLGEPCMENP